MQFKSKFVFGLMVTLLVLALAPSTFAQVSLSVFPNASPVEIANARTASINDPTTAGGAILVTGTMGASVVATNTRLIINFGVAITSAPNVGAAFVYGQFANSPFTGAVFGDISAATITAINNSTAALYTAIPAGDPISIQGTTGIFGGATGASIWTVNYSAGRIEIILPQLGSNGTNQAATQPPPATGATGSFRIHGIRIDTSALSGNTSAAPGTTAATASLSLGNSGTNNYILTTASPVTDITSLVAGFTLAAGGKTAGDANDCGKSATVFTNQVVAGGRIGGCVASMTFTEPTAAAWRIAATYADGGQANGYKMQVTFTGIPTGVTINLATANNSLGNATTVTGSVTGALNKATVTLTGTDITRTESFQLNITSITVLSSATLTAGSITATASMSPIGVALDVNSNLPTAVDGYPKFADVELPTTPLTVVNIIPSTTTMLVSLIRTTSGGVCSAPGGFDTGIAVANTTLDPFTAANGGAVPAPGTVTVTVYNTNLTAGGAGGSFIYATSSTNRVGLGLDSTGTLQPGATWLVNLCQLQAGASPTITGDLAGYAFITTNFLNAHGTATISDYKTYSLTSHVLVMPPPATTARTANTVEGGLSGLGF